MKALLIHQRGGPHGSGGVISTYGLHCGLRQAGIDSTLACRLRDVQRDDVVELPRADRRERWLGRLTWRLGLNDIHCVSAFKLPRFQPFRDADVVNIHGWHSNFFSYLALPKLARAKPIVTSLHDLWNFTGHCATPLDCQRWKTGCGRCPYLKVHPPVRRDATRIAWKLKDRACRRSDMIVTAPSRWLARLAEESMLGRFPIRYIPNAVNIDVYKPRDRRACRAEAGLPEDAHLVLFAAAALNNPLKGPDLLLEAIRNLPPEVKSKTALLLLGDQGQAIADAADVPVVDAGFVGREERKACCYAAADVLVLPTRADVQARVLLEAMACGTPCVAFDVGGVGEAVITGRTGYLAKADSAGDLRDGLVAMLADPARRAEYSARCRRFVLDNHTMEHHVDGFIEVYREALDRRRAS